MPLQYACLIYEPSDSVNATPQQQQQILGEYHQTTVRVREGKRVTTDGPFAETKEWLSGFYLVDCKSLDEALEWATKIPGAKYGSIEVRPLMEIPSAR